MEFVTHSEHETEALGQRIGKALQPGSVVLYHGDLGMGKTVLTRGIARALGYTGRVTSPTFTVVNEYDGDIPLFHFDLYRIASPDELYDLGWDDYLERSGICCIEWSERAESIFEDDAVHIWLRRDPAHESNRYITVEGLDLS